MDCCLGKVLYRFWVGFAGLFCFFVQARCRVSFSAVLCRVVVLVCLSKVLCQLCVGFPRLLCLSFQVWCCASVVLFCSMLLCLCV